jgi:hypothetical protein
LFAYVYNDHDDEDAPEMDNYLLQTSLGLGKALWLAWKDHHVMPRGGGYLDQPRWWLKLIGFFNTRYNPIYARWLDESFKSDTRDDDDDDTFDLDIPDLMSRS